MLIFTLTLLAAFYFHAATMPAAFDYFAAAAMLYAAIDDV
jgi:hypothetical protein